LFTFAGIEFSRVNMMRNTAENAAYEGARRGIVPGTTAAECEAEAAQLLADVGIVGGACVVTPNPILSTTSAVSVTVTIPIDSANAFVTPRFYAGKSVQASVSLPRETNR
jgi:hypothetical protein